MRRLKGDGRPGSDTVSIGSIQASEDMQSLLSHLISLALTCFQNLKKKKRAYVFKDLDGSLSWVKCSGSPSLGMLKGRFLSLAGLPPSCHVSMQLWSWPRDIESWKVLVEWGLRN